jgi:hypothetical protein
MRLAAVEPTRKIGGHPWSAGLAVVLFAATFWSGMLADCRPCQPGSIGGDYSPVDRPPAPCDASMLGPLSTGGSGWQQPVVVTDDRL